ncbi:hypothetical protein Tco_0887876 [Tanacetum coccineum]
MENNGGSDEHDSNAHDSYNDVKILAYNALREAENQKQVNNDLKKKKILLLQELETCKEWVKIFESKTIQCTKYNETCDELKQEIRADKDTIERILKEKDKIQKDFFKVENEKIIIQHETQLAIRLSKNEKIDILKMLLGYKNLERLKKAIAAQPKMYHDEKLYSTKLKIDSPDSKEMLEDTEESRLKMKNKMVQLDYNKLNALYETFVPQEPSVDQTYFSIHATSNIISESKEVKVESQIPKMP